MVQLTKEEKNEVVAICDHLKPLKYSPQLPYAFTEQGVAMLSSVLNSERAILVNIQIMRTFTNLRKMLASNEDLRKKIEDMERKYDEQFKIVFDAMKALLEPPVKKTKPIGFLRENDE
ncbi:MAG: ORF6N domain-containing protein [Nitrospirota bacterium]